MCTEPWEGNNGILHCSLLTYLRRLHVVAYRGVLLYFRSGATKKEKTLNQTVWADKGRSKYSCMVQQDYITMLLPISSLEQYSSSPDMHNMSG